MKSQNNVVYSNVKFINITLHVHQQYIIVAIAIEMTFC